MVEYDEDFHDDLAVDGHDNDIDGCTGYCKWRKHKYSFSSQTITVSPQWVAPQIGNGRR